MSVSSNNSSSMASAVVIGDFFVNAFAVLDMNSRVFKSKFWRGERRGTNQCFQNLGGKGEVGVVLNLNTQINVVPIQHFTTSVVKLQLSHV